MTEQVLPPAVENLLINVQLRHSNSEKVSSVARWYLHKAGEENAVRILSGIASAGIGSIQNLSGLIVFKVKECSSPFASCGEKPSAPGENVVSPPGSAVRALRGWVKEEKPMEKCGPGMSDGLSDATLLAIDVDRAPSPLTDVKREEDSVAPGGDCRSWGERPTSASAQQMMLVASQGSNDSVGCGPLLRHLEHTLTTEPEAFLGTPLSHSAEPSSSQKKRSSGSVDDGSSGSRSVKTKQSEVTDHFRQRKASALPDPLACGSPVLARRILGGSVVADGRKLDFGLEPINTPSDPHSSEIINPNPEQPKENAQAKDCAFRFNLCARQRAHLADPEVTRAYGELSFTKRFLVLDHCKESQEFPSVKELEALKGLGLEEVDNRLYHRFRRPDHIAPRDWSKKGDGHMVFTCTVSHSGACEFSGPRFENGGTPLERAFGEENVLIVKFEDTPIDHHNIIDRYRCLAHHGILCGLKKFCFYAFKDAESKKKQGVSKNKTYGCKCVFIAIESSASADSQDSMKKFPSISEARNYIMHPTVPTLAKAISRLQLALSQTTQVPLDWDKVCVKPLNDINCTDEKGNDVKDANGKNLVHTDGCGFIAKNLAKLIQDVVVKGIKQQPEKVDWRGKQEYPLMMQVRLFWKGNLWKGVLVVNLQIPDNMIQVRPSMLKVERDEKRKSATFNSLELCNTRLGGIKEETLLKYVETSVEKLKENFSSSKEALRVAGRKVDTHHSGFLACEMLLSGLEPSKEPFLQKVISEMVKCDLQKYSLGKVPVPDTAYLMGCADPTGLLQRHQVAILVGNGSRICRERVIVYKPPGLHPGDVHIFEATWIKGLEAFVGTGTYGIIFSTKGARSVTDEMAGSDLDGDQYWVSWNPELVDSFNASPPWEAPNVLEDKKPSLRPTAEVEFEKQHFEKFIQTRFDPSVIKGRAANAWLALTDCTMSDNVTKKDQMHAKEHISTLVDLFYQSLDAEKSGKEVRWPSQLHVNLFPHFLEKNKDDAAQDPSKPWSASNRIGTSGRKPQTKKHQEYPSTSILGKMYDMVKKEDFDKPLNVDIDNMFEYDGYKDYHEEWRCLFAQYCSRTASALQALELGSSNEQEFRNCVYDKLLAEYKEKFLGEGKSNEQLLKEASAIYTVVYGKAVVQESQALQFAWKIAGSQLCKIRAEKRGGSLCLARENLDFFLRR